MFRLHIFVTYRPALKISWFSGNTLVESVFLLKEVVFIMIVLLFSGLLVKRAIVATPDDLYTSSLRHLRIVGIWS